MIMFSLYVLCLIIFCLKLALVSSPAFSLNSKLYLNGLFLGFFRSTALDTKLTTEQYLFEDMQAM